MIQRDLPASAQTSQGTVIGRVEFSEAPTYPPTNGRRYFAFR